ncbi:MAG: hypothetical protein OES32_16000 [Acidobacteriota bacterium]|nr:hypothetical protein [Acidobacteriota bacterium]MDH3525079.1 hypothetical protein [Acidobacteriota bacterium]
MKRRLAPSLLLLASLAAGSAGATSYVAMSDRALFEQAPAIAQVSVLSVGPAPAQGAPSVDYIVVVERLLKGTIAGSTVVVRVAGGVGPDGWGLDVVGAPRLGLGDRAILFLVPRQDGTYGILHMMLGAFYELRAGGQHLALRDLQDARELGAGDGSEPAALPRDFDRFAEWLAGGARDPGGDEGSGYLVAVPSRRLERLQEAFALLRHERRRLRWFEDAVEWRLDRRAPDGSRRRLKEALRAWTPVAGLRLAYGGRSDAEAGLATFDGVNVVTFGDAGEVIPGAFSCREGGVVAVGGPWFDPEVTAKSEPGAAGAAAIRILGADIMLNDGADCLLDGFEEVSREALMHELGHTLGLGYACGDSLTGICAGDADESVMRALLPTDGRARRPGELERRRLADPD